MDYVLDGYCGVFCGACPVMLATKAGKQEGDMSCYGCKSEKPTGFCATCGIQACAQGKGYEFCDQCSQLQTCELMLKFVADPQYPYGQCVLKNMEAVRLAGLPQWLQAQQERWRCTACGAAHSWYHQTCPACGQAVASYQADL